MTLVPNHLLLSIFLSLTVVTPWQKPMHKRMVFVVDVSGSMDSSFEQALKAVGTVLKQPVDEGEFCIYSFDTTWFRWPHKGYKKLPSAYNVRKAEKWLGSKRRGGSTQALGTLAQAIKEPQLRTIVLVTDGELYDDPSNVLEQIRGQEPILVFGVHLAPTKPKLKLLSAKGGYYRVQK